MVVMVGQLNGGGGHCEPFCGDGNAGKATIRARACSTTLRAAACTKRSRANSRRRVHAAPRPGLGAGAAAASAATVVGARRPLLGE